MLGADFYFRPSRIDNANAGWKGRGHWMTYSSYLPKFTETELGSVDHFQLRPNPLAKYLGVETAHLRPCMVNSVSLIRALGISRTLGNVLLWV